MGNRGPGAFVVFPEFQRTLGAVEVPYGCHPRTDDVDVCWPVIIRIDDYPEPINSVDRKHTILYTKPKRLGIIIYAARLWGPSLAASLFSVLPLFLESPHDNEHTSH
jgi:hypothetical protein